MPDEATPRTVHADEIVRRMTGEAGDDPVADAARRADLARGGAAWWDDPVAAARAEAPAIGSSWAPAVAIGLGLLLLGAAVFGLVLLAIRVLA